MIGLIYEYKNKVNGKRYVGQTIQTLQARQKEGYFNTKFANALLKYGEENFEVKILYELEAHTKEKLISDLNVLEEIIIMRDSLQDDRFGYNIKAGGFNGTFKHTSEAIEKIRQASKRPNKGQFKKGSTPWIKGRKIVQTEEQKRNISIGLKKAYAEGRRESWNKGKIMSNEHKEKISIANKGVKRGQYPTHSRWHKSRNIVNLTCSYCKVVQ